METRDTAPDEATHPTTESMMSTKTYLTVAAEDLGEEALDTLSQGDPIDDAILHEIRHAGEHVTDPLAYLDGREGWWLDEDGNSHYESTA